ncbi:MAG: hypothetical protein CM15mP98_11860 [Paracoccaceae bacterium]|nr:MAG: hypothetical protein CM15mP98_11860 [Paracoccaceae bacterium]
MPGSSEVFSEIDSQVVVSKGSYKSYPIHAELLLQPQHNCRYSSSKYILL